MQRLGFAGQQFAVDHIARQRVTKGEFQPVALERVDQLQFAQVFERGDVAFGRVGEDFAEHVDVEAAAEKRRAREHLALPLVAAAQAFADDGLQRVRQRNDARIVARGRAVDGVAQQLLGEERIAFGAPAHFVERRRTQDRAISQRLAEQFVHRAFGQRSQAYERGRGVA